MNRVVTVEQVKNGYNITFQRRIRTETFFDSFDDMIEDLRLYFKEGTVVLTRKIMCWSCGAGYGAGIEVEAGRCRICGEHLEPEEK